MEQNLNESFQQVTSSFSFDPIFADHKKMFEFKQVQEELFLDDVK